MLLHTRQVLACDSAFNSFNVYGRLAHRKTAVPQDTEMDNSKRTINGSTPGKRSIVCAVAT